MKIRTHTSIQKLSQIMGLSSQALSGICEALSLIPYTTCKHTQKKEKKEIFLKKEERKGKFP
jgi:hypothetical protein